MRNICAFILLVTIFACGEDVDCDPNTFASEINAEVAEVNRIGEIFINDASEENCQAYKKAAEDYLDAVEKYENCTEVDANQFQQQLTQARELLSIIPCN